MRVSIAKQLIRFALFVLILQFLSPALVQAGCRDLTTSSPILTEKIDQSLNQLILLTENNLEEKEKEGDAKESLLSLELVDFSFVIQAIAFRHSQDLNEPSNSIPSAQIQFDLRCILII